VGLPPVLSFFAQALVKASSSDSAGRIRLFGLWDIVTMSLQ